MPHLRRVGGRTTGDGHCQLCHQSDDDLLDHVSQQRLTPVAAAEAFEIDVVEFWDSARFSKMWKEIRFRLETKFKRLSESDGFDWSAA